MGKIYFKTTSYHAEKTLHRCVDSVLNQTYRGEDIIYYICNNPYTQPDPTEAMVREYAASEPRIRAFYNKENRVMLPENAEFSEFTKTLTDDDYLCFLDSDDAYELNLLEELLPFMEENRLDIAACGSDFIDAATGKVCGQRQQPNTLLLLEPRDFADYFPYYHQFMRTMWGKIYSGRVAREMLTPVEFREKYPKFAYGSDTLYVFSALRHAERVGIYPKSLHRYYMSTSSDSSKYPAVRPESDVIRHEDAVDYLSALGPISQRNREFLACVYVNAVFDSLSVLSKQSMPPQEKLRECRKIAEHPATQENYGYRDENGYVTRSRRTLFILAAQSFAAGGEYEDLAAVITVLAPDCAVVASPENVGLITAEPKLLEAFLNDDREALLSVLLALLREQKHTKKYDICAMVRALAENKPLLKEIDDKMFLRRHGGIFLSVWKEQYTEALDNMTGMLLEGEKTNETFLQLYLRLAALHNHAEAYVFGKIRLAEHKLRHGERDACRAVLDELEEMGAGEADEVKAMKKTLGKS